MTAAEGPLAGVRVVDLSNVISGPMAACWLADQGADVIKVETPAGDMTRGLGPTKGDISAMFLTANRGKRSIVLDLKQADDCAMLSRLIADADVLVENFRPGAMARMGFDWPRAQALNPRLVYCSISGYGSSGPLVDARVYDPVIQAASGIAHSQRHPVTGAPVLLQGLYCDKVTALTAAQAITAALFARERTGKGQHVELAMLDAAIAFLWPEGMYNETFMDEPPPRSPDFGSFYRLWPTRDGWMALSAVQNSEFKAVADALELPDMHADPRFADAPSRMRNAAALLEMMGSAIASLTSAEVMERFLKHGAPGAAVTDRGRLAEDPQVQHNGSIIRFQQGDAGEVRNPRHPARFHGTPLPVTRAAPGLNAHGAEIRAEKASSVRD